MAGLYIGVRFLAIMGKNIKKPHYADITAVF